MRLMIAGGGTGGHLYPGVAVAEELNQRGEDHAVLFAGSTRGIEARVLPALGLDFEPVRGAGLVGAGLAGKLRGLGMLLLGFIDAIRVVGKFRPQVCLGVGGYVSFPVAALCRLLGVKLAIQEQNATPGLANRVLGRFAHRIYAGDEAAVPRFPNARVLITGNPLRQAFDAPFHYESPRPGEPVRMLVLGGSQGARSLNETVPAAVAGLDQPLEIRHQAGRGKTGPVRAAYGDRDGVRVEEFIEGMAEAYRWAHIVVARAGALTVAELAGAGRPALLVPFPLAAGNHQEANARAAQARGAALCMTERELTPERLTATLADWIGQPEQLAAMAGAASASARRDAAARIVNDLFTLSGATG